MKPIVGFRDQFGADLRRRRYLGSVLGSVAESFGYEPLEVPVLEHAEAYSESVVGLSPWPEWNRKGMFEIEILNYRSDYQTDPESERAVLIPEGTLSVTRWLGDRLSSSPNPLTSPDLPLKIYYEVSCYRNELVATLSAAKGRQFTQFGIEVLGADSIAGDLEVVAISAEGLRAIGVTNSAIRFRISSNRLFMALAERSGLNDQQRVALKEHLDTIGECKAGKRPERLDRATRDALQVAVSSPQGRANVGAWRHIIERHPGPVSPGDVRAIGRELEEDIEYLRLFSKLVSEEGVRIDVDYCVVRSHEYYTGLTFEIDLIGASGVPYVEVGGGGRYDRLLGSFIDTAPGVVIPSMGYAYGLERLQAALVAEGFLSERLPPVPFSRNLSLAPMIRHSIESDGMAKEDVGRSYLRTLGEFRERRQKEAISVCL